VRSTVVICNACSFLKYWAGLQSEDDELVLEKDWELRISAMLLQAVAYTTREDSRGGKARSH
jgi:hypothetical protein